MPLMMANVFTPTRRPIRVGLLVNDDNVAARGLYESLGFTPSDRFGFLFGATGAS
jgi:ribosomal protein S18 acetylase RimI-like enzyme